MLIIVVVAVSIDRYCSYFHYLFVVNFDIVIGNAIARVIISIAGAGTAEQLPSNAIQYYTTDH